MLVIDVELITGVTRSVVTVNVFDGVGVLLLLLAVTITSYGVSGMRFLKVADVLVEDGVTGAPFRLKV